MVDRPARFNQPEGPGIFPPGSEAIGSAVHLGTTFANRLGPDENLLRQYQFHFNARGSKDFCTILAASDSPTTTPNVPACPSVEANWGIVSCPMNN